MLLLISDTNILFDFEDGGLLDELFRLDAVIAVPDVILDEELEEIGGDLVRRGLRALSLTGESVLRVVALARLRREGGT